MSDPDSEDYPEPQAQVRRIVLDDSAAGERLDKALATVATELSRARIQALIAAGALSRGDEILTDASARARPGAYDLGIPPAAPAEPLPEAMALTVIFEDDQLIVVDKAPGMAVHPAPGSERGTLVNALLHHCGSSLSGIGGVARPGIVHRIDKDTSGLLVVAKTDVAHVALSALFAAHDIARRYIALTRGAPTPLRGEVSGRIGRSPHDRKKMAVLKSGGREATTHYVTERAFGPATRPLAARVACELETGRTHQIRVHLASRGAPCLGDPLYGSGPPAAAVRQAMAEAGLARQALHAAVLGFRHPTSGEMLHFESPLPPDMARLERLLEGLGE